MPTSLDAIVHCPDKLLCADKVKASIALICKYGCR